jgi:hypothetical protein
VIGRHRRWAGLAVINPTAGRARSTLRRHVPER